MDLYRLPRGHSKSFPEGYRFSWIAYDSEDVMARVLFDCHHPKGPHVHVDQDPSGKAVEWVSLESSYERFFKIVRDRFGDFEVTEESTP